MLLAALPAAAGLASGVPVQWRPLPAVQSAMGTTNVLWDGDSVCFSNGQTWVRFYQGRRKSDVNGTTVWLNAQPDGSVSDGDWRIAGIDLDLLQLSLLPCAEGQAKPVRVLLDPGHGGDDEGASSKDPVVKEKDLTLTLAKKIGAQLKKDGFHVDYTRTRDTTLALDERSRLARVKKADIFVSIHANYAANREACGVETYILPPSGYPGTADGSRSRGWQIGNRNDYHNTLLGFSLHQKLASHDDAIDRGLKRQSFFVLRETTCPAVLLEFGFLSNAGETRKMLDKTWQEQSVRAVVEGIRSYARKVDSLDKAVAEKRARDEEMNERWRQRLAAQAAKPAPATNVVSAAKSVSVAALPQPARTAPTEPSRTSAAPPPSSHPAPGTGSSPAPQPHALTGLSNMVASVSSIAAGGTNAVPEIHTLLDFYSSGKVQ